MQDRRSAPLLSRTQGAVLFAVLWTAGMLWWNAPLDAATAVIHLAVGALVGLLWYWQHRPDIARGLPGDGLGPGQTPGHRVLWAAVNALIWTPGLALGTLGLLQMLRVSIAMQHEAIVLLASALLFFLAQFGARLAGRGTPALRIDRICADPMLSSREKARLLLRDPVVWLVILLVALCTLIVVREVW